MSPRTLGCAGVLALVASSGWACGVCIDDKVAATYDHAVLQRATGRGEVVVFCELGGAANGGRIRAAAARIRGLDPASVRISAQPAALSFAVDPVQQSPQAAVAALQRALPSGAHVAILHVVTVQGFAAAQR